MEKAYNPKTIEEEIYKAWEEAGYFSPAESDPGSTKEPFVIIMPPPNVNGVLHAGHAVFVTLQDIMIRYNRMKGKSCLWVPGADHAGIATQVSFEKILAKKGKTRFDLGREKFCQETYQFSMENRQSMEDQLRKLGASCDWQRKRFTLEPKISQAVFHTFEKMYREGLIYRGERIINWCSRCQTALSDLEVKYQEKPGELFYLNYPIVDSQEFITVATTRPETMLGDTAVAVNPEDKRYQKILKRKVKLKLPLTDRTIPLIADKRIQTDFGTGAVKITPAHDLTDFEIGKDNNLPIINVIGKDGRMTKEAGENYAGMKISECREKVLQEMGKLELLKDRQPYRHSVGVCERCQTVVEPLVSRQWFIKMEKLAKPAIEAVKRGEIKFIPRQHEKVYFHWMENIKDWCISRQIWWGHRIPVWYCSCGETIVSQQTPEKCPKCGNSELRQDPDTLDTWFSSGQWPFTVFGWPEKTADFKKFYPTSVMETGHDILFFWVARMIMLGIYCTGQAPFEHVFLHGLVRDKDKQKMSKSKGNVVNPLGVVELHGADALRMALVFSAAPGKDIIVSEEKIIAQRRFANKIWNASRFVLQKLENQNDFLEKPAEDSFTPEDKWILTETRQAAETIGQAIENFQFHLAAEKAYDFFWHTFCDKAIENSKTRDDSAARWTLYHVLLDSLKMIHPFMPFITEKIYQMLPQKSAKALIIETWSEIK